MDDPRAFLSSLFQAAIDAASPGKRVPLFLPKRPKGRTIVVGAGKAAASMAAAVEPRGGSRWKASSSHAMAMARRRSSLKSSRPRIPFPMRRVRPRRSEFSIGSRGLAKTISCCV